MKKIFIILLSILSYSGSLLGQTTTVTFKPGAEVGQDAQIFTSYGRNLYGNTQPMEFINEGNSLQVPAMAWTFNGNEGTIRCLLKFAELSTIPKDTKIISAKLKLYGVPSGDINSSYPGSGFSNNQSVIQKVTSAWEENTVTWSTQPTTTELNQINIPESTSQYNWNYTDSSQNLVAMVQDMVSNPESNFGFMLRLATEEMYRSIVFASSDHGDSALHPELTVTYENCSIENIIKDKFKVVIVKNPNKIKEKYKIVRVKKFQDPVNSAKVNSGKSKK